MTLSRQFNLLILAIVSIIFIGTILITVDKTRSHFLIQLENNAQDTATSLGLSLTGKMKDKVLMLSMIDAIFDRGYFESIKVVDSQGNKIIERHLQQASYSVPDWFVSIVELPLVERRANIMSGWVQSGEIIVESFPDVAYRNLWLVTQYLFYWYLGLTALALLVGFITIRFLFRPLQRVVKQAKSICEQDFIVETNIPKTLELKQVTKAINKMVAKVKEVFVEQINLIEKLNDDSFKDPLLKIGNRRFFMQNLASFLDNEENYRTGFIIITELSNLIQFNKTHGFKEGDLLIENVNNALLKSFESNQIFIHARIGGSTFATILLDSDEETKIQIQNALDTIVTDIKPSENKLQVHIGAAACQLNMNVGQAMAAADNALQQAQSKGMNAYYLLSHADEFQTKPATDWLSTMKSAIAEQRLVLYTQNIMNSKQNIYHQEVFINLKTKNGELLSAGIFLPMVEKLSFGFTIDRYVISELFQYLNQSNAPVAINLSSSSVYDLNNQHKIIEQLKGIPAKFRKQFQFEISETIILSYFESSMQLITNIRTLGCKVGIDRVGANFSNLLHKLSQLKINYLKIDGSYTQDFANDTDKQHFMHHVHVAASTLGIDIIATNIENEEQWQALLATKVDLGQGRYLGNVEPI